jgi:hypothetical protein
VQSVPIATKGVLDTTLCDKVCQWLATGQWFSPVSSTNKTDCHDITEILLKVALSIINQPLQRGLIVWASADSAFHSNKVLNTCK